MAEQVPYGVATSLINTLASLAFREIASVYGVKSEIEKMKETVEGIKAVLADADQKQQTSQLIQLWIRNLKQVLYEADDLLDEVHTKDLLRQRDAKGKRKVKVKVRYFLSSSRATVFGSKITRKIRKIREQFNAVAEKMSKLNLDRRVVVEMKHEKSSNWRETSSSVRQEDIVGREANKNDIIDLLLNHNNGNQNVSLVAIVGIGGLGKTALAQLVYKNADVEPLKFKKRMWVCVAEDFDVKALVKKMLESLLVSKEGDQTLDSLQQKLQQNLDGERYLLVLDDVWNVATENWSHLKNYLMCGAQGSKILVTTRDLAVANQMGVKTPYVLKGLDNDQSWTLLKRLAFDQDEIVTQNLESIGRKIAEKCAGVPLAIRAVGSFLQSKLHEDEWEATLEAPIFKSCKDGNSIMPILKLSYEGLPIELKQCFVYCSLYPKDWRYEKGELIYLWMAQGFLENNEDESQCPEDVGEKYVHSLLMKSFLQDVERDELGEIKYFKMHDLMHDMAQSIASPYHSMSIKGKNNVVRCPTHASFEEMEGKYERNPSNFSIFKRLRSLDLSVHYMRDLPISIGKMSHLRYLCVSYCFQLTCLPKSIGNLVNLQTLRLYRCPNVKFSEDIITKLINLRRLDIQAHMAFKDGMPIGLGKMITLQSLSHFIVANDNKKKKKAKLNELKELNLRGRLVIGNLGSVRDVEEESKDVNLKTKKNLISLTLKWGYSKMKNNDAMQLLENLRPHQNLKALTINEYPGVCLSDWLLSCTNLVQVKFSSMKNCQYLAALEGLVFLKTLHLKWMDKLECIYYKECSSSTNFFASLKKLQIWGCRSLRGWQREANVQNTGGDEWHHSLPPFSRLSSLEISGCPNLRYMPTFPNLMRHLTLIGTSTKPLLDTLNVSTSGPSTSNNVAPSLSMLKSLNIEGIDIEALPVEWMQNLSSLEHLSFKGLSNPEKLFHHMQNLSATLEVFSISGPLSWNGHEDYNIQYQELRCLHSLQTIKFECFDHLKTLPGWICDLQSLRSIYIAKCPNLESFPEGMHRLTNLQTLQLRSAPQLKERCKRGTGTEWPKIAHIPNIWINWVQI